MTRATQASELRLYERKGTYVPRVAAVHDLCGYGKCSLGAAIPVLSAAGIDVCPVPTSLFSAHTKFPTFYMHDTTSMLDGYLDAWVEEGVELDGVYSGFLGSAEQVGAIRRLYREHPRAVRIVDPVMGDGGETYPTYTRELCDATRGLVDGADVLTPNLTEASILTGVPYEGTSPSDGYVRRVCEGMLALGARAVVLKGVVHEDEGALVNYVAMAGEGGACSIEPVPGTLLPYMLHGTGDLFASALTAAIFAGRDLRSAVDFAGGFVRDAMRITLSQPDYEARGVTFEPVLGQICALIA